MASGPGETDNSHLGRTGRLPRPPNSQCSFAQTLVDAAYRWWFLEVIALLTSVVFLAAILGVAVKFNYHEIELTGYFSKPPASTINILVSGMRTALLLPTANAIAQLKWKWFDRQRHEGRHLSDMEAFDAASRGVLGSVKLLMQPKFL